MSTPSLETESPVQQTELIRHEFSADGVCTNPEQVMVPMPSGCACAIELALDSEQKWRHGFSLRRRGKDGPPSESLAPNISGPAFPTRAAALKEGLRAAALFFQKDKGAILALENFHAKLAAPEKPAVEEAKAPPVAIEAHRGTFAQIPVAQIEPNPVQPRKFFNPITEADLAESIQQHGLLQPIAVREVPAEELAAVAEASPPPARYQIILGERRWRAHKRLNLETIDAKVYVGVSLSKARVLALVENLHRDQMNPIEEAEGFCDLIAEGYTHEQVGKMVNRPRSLVSNGVRILGLPDRVIDLIRTEQLTMWHGLILARFKEFPAAVTIIAENAARDKLSARDIDKRVPYAAELARAELAISIRPETSPTPFPAKFEKHPAYFPDGDGAFVCLEPAHWRAEVDRYSAEKKKTAAEEREALEAALKKGKKVKIEDLDPRDYVDLSEDRFSAMAGISKLIPDDQRATAKGEDGREVPIATDPEFVEKLRDAAEAVMEADRADKLPRLAQKARERIAALKRIGTREIAWLLAYVITGYPVELKLEAAGRQGVKLPEDMFIETSNWVGMEGFQRLNNIDQVAFIRVLLDQEIQDSCDNVLRRGIDHKDVDLLRWVLEVDSLGLLEETDEGRKEILRRVSDSEWYKESTATAAKK